MGTGVLQEYLFSELSSILHIFTGRTYVVIVRLGSTRRPNTTAFNTSAAGLLLTSVSLLLTQQVQLQLRPMATRRRVE